MSALPVRYTNNHHVAPSKTASPIVVAVNKTGLAGCCVQSAYHRQQQQQHQRHHQTPPVKRHPTKMAAARRAKSRSRSRASAASGTSAGSPAKRRNGKAGAKKLPQLMSGPQSQQQQSERTQQTEQQQQQVAASLTAQQMVLDVVAATSSNGAPEATNTVGDAGRRTTTSVEWGTQVLVGEDVLRTPDAAACERLLAATEDLQQQPGNVTDHETGLVVRSQQQQQHNNNMNEMHLMDTSEAMEDDDSELPSTSAGCSGVAGGVDADSPAVVVAPRRSNEELFAELQEALALEPKYQPSLYLPQSSQVSQKRGLGKGAWNNVDYLGHQIMCLSNTLFFFDVIQWHYYSCKSLSEHLFRHEGRRTTSGNVIKNVLILKRLSIDYFH